MMITWLRWRLPGAYNMTILSLSLLYQSVFIITLLGYKFTHYGSQMVNRSKRSLVI